MYINHGNIDSFAAPLLLVEVKKDKAKRYLKAIILVILIVIPKMVFLVIPKIIIL